MNFSLFQYTNCVILLHKATLHNYDVVKLCRVKMSLRCLRGNELGSPTEDLIGNLNRHLNIRFRYIFEVLAPVLGISMCCRSEDF